ncbi:MAG: NAD-dependent epimerase/dehydratase family protein [Chloroflexota bacterium]
MTTIAVTGASGFVARHLIPQLLSEGHEVRGIARHTPDHTGSAGTIAGFQFIPGDVRQPDPVRQTLDGCEQVVHLAASFTPSDDGAAINVEGTRQVLAVSKAAGVQRFIFVSCLGADAAAHSPFYASKWRAEQLVRSAGLPFCILRPSLIVGNGDGVLRPLAAALRGLPALPVAGAGQTRVQPIDVGDVCRCVISALCEETSRDDSVSLGGPLFLTFRELADLVAGELNVVRRKLLLPRPLMAAVAGALPAAARPLYSPARLAQFEQGVVASPGIVNREFGFEPANVIPGLASYLA